MRAKTIEYGRRCARYTLERNNGKHLSISVTPAGQVRVRVPAHAPDDEVHRRVQRRARWIFRQIDEFTELQPVLKERRYVSGETHRYLGRQYRLKVKAGTGRSVKLIGGFFEVYVPDRHDRESIRRRLERWYRDQAVRVFDEAMRACLQAPSLRGISPPALSIRFMSKRWGSCSKSGRILLNPLLVRTPRPCIEYVIAHELCHLIEHNHGPAFYRLLSRVQPDWRVRRERLSRCEA